MIGNITPAPDRFGEEGMACNFDGASFVNVPDTPAIHLQAMTISLWVQFDTTSDTVNLVNKDDFGQGYQLFKSGDDSVFFGIGDAEELAQHGRKCAHHPVPSGTTWSRLMTFRRFASL